MELKAFLEKITCDQEEFKDERDIESVRKALIKSISSDSRLSGRHSHDDGLIMLADVLNQDPTIRKQFYDFAARILDLFPVEKEEKPQE